VQIDLSTLVVIIGLAAIAPIAADLAPRPAPPLVVVEILLGILVGPPVLAVGSSSSSPASSSSSTGCGARRRGLRP
jgi:Kef-type K+ transport system membrane component KefB